jgi:hypothetical protein
VWGGVKWGHVLLQDDGVVSVTFGRLGSVRVAWRVRLTMPFVSTGMSKGVTALGAASTLRTRGVDSGCRGVGLPRHRWGRVDAVAATMGTPPGSRGSAERVVLLLWLRGMAAVRFVMCAPSATSSFSRVHCAEQPTRL